MGEKRPRLEWRQVEERDKDIIAMFRRVRKVAGESWGFVIGSEMLSANFERNGILTLAVVVYDVHIRLPHLKNAVKSFLPFSSRMQCYSSYTGMFWVP